MLRPCPTTNPPIRMLMAVVLLAAVVWTTSAATASAAPRAKARQVTVMTYNIHHGAGVDGRLDLDRVAAVIRASGADIVSLQEVDRHYGDRSAFADQPALLAKALNMHVAYGPNLDLDPLVAGQPRRQYGNAILSRYPILRSRNVALPRLAGQEQRGFLEALVNVRGVPLRVGATHLQHDSAEARRLQAAAILDVIGTADTSIVLLGDLNARPGDAEIVNLLARLVDAWVQAGLGAGLTFPSPAPYARIDYVLQSGDVVARTAAVLASDASDHRPVVAALALPGDRVGVGKAKSVVG